MDAGVHAESLPCSGPAVFIGNVVVVGDTFPTVTVEHQAIAVDADGIIVFTKRMDPCESASVRDCFAALGCQAPVWTLSETELLLPGFVDGHIHAPQYAYVGLGTDRPLMGPSGWLEHHAFPAESRLASDLPRARAVFAACVERVLRLGTTTAVYFATQSRDVTAVLAECCARAGQRAFVGRVAMDRHCPPDYCDASAQAGAADSAASVDGIAAKHGPRVQGALTPRFVPSCSGELLGLLGKLAAERPQVLVQSHISESTDEVEFTRVAENDAAARDAALLDKHGLLRAPAIMAHAVHLLPEELDLLAKRGCAIAHCPLSNAFFAGGSLDVLDVLRRGCRVALGTDVAGGYHPSMLSAMRQAVVTSREVHKSSATDSLTWRGALWLATAGGAEALGVARTCGRLAVGRAFDALLVDAEPWAGAGVAPYEARELEAGGEEGPLLAPDALLERFVNLGDDRNIAAVYVGGQRVVPRGGGHGGGGVRGSGGGASGGHEEWGGAGEPDDGGARSRSRSPAG